MAITSTRVKLQYQLTNPGYTIYHRAALGGLAATIHAWGKDLPEGIRAGIDKNEAWLDWDSNITDQEALKRILAASFKLTKDGMIDLPGQGIGTRDDLRLAIHNSIMSTFLEHPQLPGKKQIKKLTLKLIDDPQPRFLSFKSTDLYANQIAHKTGLLDEKLKGNFPDQASIPKYIIPGAFEGAHALESRSSEVILLLYLIVGSALFQLRPRQKELKKFQYCLVMPDVTDLKAFARSLNRISSAGGIELFTNSATGRVVGGSEEAALKFLIDLHTADNILGERSVSGCQAIAMGKVAWDKNQINRSISIKIRDDYPEIGVFRASLPLGRTKIHTNEKDEVFMFPGSHLPELIAANLASNRHWCSHFKEIVAEQKGMKEMSYAHVREGLIKMKQAIKSDQDQLVIDAFHDAWRQTMANIFDRAKREGLDVRNLLDGEKEKIRNSILRAKTSDALAGWFLRFVASATKGSSLPSIRQDSASFREFIFNSRNFERFQNLCLFALVSYERKGEEQNAD